jgi:hypothetical protein
MDVTARHFSSLFRETRGLKARLEANLHRYTLLLFMITVIVGGGVIAFIILGSLRSW